VSNPNYSSADDDTKTNDRYPYSEPVDAIAKDHPKLTTDDRYPYSEPIDAIVKDHPKLASDDYQVLPAFKKADIPYQYEAATTTMYQNSLDDSYTLPDHEQVYEDPGHVEKNIYAWFEKKKLRMIRKNNIRYV